MFTPGVSETEMVDVESLRSANEWNPPAAIFV
jgi:hypothetical protein